jgi:hypothetical protein
VQLAGEDGLMAVETAHDWLTARGVDSVYQDQWIDHTEKFRRVEDHLIVWTGSLVDKCVAMLALRGTPSDAETLVDLVGEGHNLRGARSRFFGDPRMIRVNRSDWALRSWGIEEYTGITDEIAQRVEAAGGEVDLSDLTAELTEQFGVRAGSVQAYAEAPMFVIERGRVRLRRPDEPYIVTGDLASCRGVYVPGPDHISVVLDVDKETLRGSGRRCPPPVAAAVGVAPGMTRTWTSTEGFLTITWPRTAAFGPSFGSTRALVQSAGAFDGDRVRLDLNLANENVTCELIPELPSDLTSAKAIALLCGLTIGDGDDIVKCLAGALHVSPEDVRRRLHERGDDEVAALLPTPAIDSSLEAALSDLANVLGDR